MRFDQTSHSGYYFLDSDEGIWNSGADRGGKNLGYRPRYKEGYFPVPPTDALQDVRSQIVLNMIAAGIDVEVHHHEVATAGQCEIDMRFQPLVKMADQLMLYKYIVKNDGQGAGLQRDVHAQAALRRQWQRHALPPEPVEERRAAILR